ncbi:MAG TPA: hypothetical protein VGR19_08705 [Allosphingosinicella sp.]|nr:hypothetical protein [Allosphingosinicella sp.]
MKKVSLLLGLLMASLLSTGCAGINTATRILRSHPAHCEMAVQVVTNAIAQRVVPPTLTFEERERLIHQTQGALFLGGICSAP